MRVDSRQSTGGWRLATGDWRLAAGGWRSSFLDCRLSTVDCRLFSGWRLAAGGRIERRLSSSLDFRLSTFDFRLLSVWPSRSPTVDCRLSTVDFSHEDFPYGHFRPAYNGRTFRVEHGPLTGSLRSCSAAAMSLKSRPHGRRGTFPAPISLRSSRSQCCRRLHAQHDRGMER
jgi:hypothetical protein